MSDAARSSRLMIALLSLPSVGRKTAVRIADSLPTVPTGASDLFSLLDDARATVPRLRGFTRDEATTAMAEADGILDQCSSLGLHAIALGEDRFPSRLRAIDDPPAVLYCRCRSWDWVSSPSVAIIGTREPTDYGRKTAARFATRAVEAGFVVVSGLALGCDVAAHIGCIEAGGTTVAAMAHGLETVYPAAHREIAERMLELRGALVSEYAPGTKARPNFFVERDRLQSGLSLGVIVVETDIEGGTMHTVGFAAKQGRPVAVLSHPSSMLSEPKSRGNQSLIRAGQATALGEIKDLSTFFEGLSGRAPLSQHLAPSKGSQGMLF